MKIPYNFSILRYTHDPLTQEFINVGVALYAPSAGYIGAICTSRFGRISNAFGAVDGSHFRRQTEYIQARIDEFGDRLEKELPLNALPKSIEQVTSAVLPPDDSSFQFSAPGGGIAGDLDVALDELFDRYVDKYCRVTKRPARTEDDVWRSFRPSLEKRQVLSHLKPVKIVGSDYEHEFDYAWKNLQWHTLQPLSFDLADAGNIMDKANTWLGRAQSLSDSKEGFQLYFLLGSPMERKLGKAFDKAKNILHKMTVKHEFVKEDEAEDFAENLYKEIEAHEKK